MVVATVNAVVGTSYVQLTFDAPALTGYSANTPMTGAVTLFGLNFGFADFSAMLRIAATGCATTSWISVTSIGCRLHPGTTSVATSSLTASTLIGTQALRFSYDTPVATAGSPSNAALNGMALSVTIFGLNFNVADVTQTAIVGGMATMTMAWTSQTTVSVYTSATRYTKMVIGRSGVWGTSNPVFAFDAPVLSHAFPFASKNIASSGATYSVTITGLNFNSIDPTPSQYVGQFLMPTVSWISTTSVVGVPGSGSVSSYHLDVNSNVGTYLAGTNAFSFDSPLLSFAWHTSSTGTRYCTLFSLVRFAVRWTACRLRDPLLRCTGTSRTQQRRQGSRLPFPAWGSAASIWTRQRHLGRRYVTLQAGQAAPVFNAWQALGLASQHRRVA